MALNVHWIASPNSSRSSPLKSSPMSFNFSLDFILFLGKIMLFCEIKIVNFFGTQELISSSLDKVGADWIFPIPDVCLVIVSYIQPANASPTLNFDGFKVLHLAICRTLTVF